MKNKGNLIAELRREAGYTQKTLAEALHITDKAVSKWERGLSLPDVSLLSKLSLLLGADMSLILAPDGKQLHEGWRGVIDLRKNGVDLRRTVYDKPLVYFLLSHFLLSDVGNICFLLPDGQKEANEGYLKDELFSDLGFEISFSFEDVKGWNLIILDRPCFVFGSDLTRLFQGAIVSDALLKLAPVNISPPFLFCPSEYSLLYETNPAYLFDNASVKTLGRGMVCLEMDTDDSILDVSSFVRIYQKSSGLLVGSLEEIAFKKQLIDEKKLIELSKKVAYGDYLTKLTK